ncbi:hypothetical protein [Halostreptopolyspora alba]|uniref:WD40 repeat domain-containing protein n=1 Tax=Halostreptopolyspora alba TaxID=2487137 RepID=A0A3N0E8A1_9ACTN|nr:hypothetical protein EFW17_14015 [Nocardiopsaceae bacterium YIM 96095]
MRERVAVVPIALAVTATLGAADPTPTDSPESDVPEGTEELFRLEDPRIAESSGLTVSARHGDHYWTHNDSGDIPPEIYAINSDGETEATVTLSGPEVEARDWEAISTGVDDSGEPALYVGDIGDNFQGAWPDIRVYRLTEPTDLVDQTVEVETFTLRFEDGARDAEGMMVDPRDNRLYVVSKEVAGGLYAAPETLDPEGVNELSRIGSAPLYSTDAAFAADGSHYAIRTYWATTVFDASEGVPGDNVAHVSLPDSKQGESLAFAPDGTSLLAGTEGEHGPVWSVPLPEEVTAAGDDTGKGGDQTEPAASPEERSESASALIWGGIGVAALLVAGILLLARRS